MTLGERLHKIRKQHGISQEELGKRLMVSRQTIGNKNELTVEKNEDIIIVERIGFMVN